MPENLKQPPVLVTGAAGHIGSLLVERLSESGRQVIGLDVKRPDKNSANLVFHETDLTLPLNRGLLGDQGLNTVVHLAFQMREGRSRREAERIKLSNLECLHNVLEASAAAGAEHFIYLSSHTVYGARSENPVPITEDYKSKPSVSFQYSATKALSEQALWDFQRHHPEINITVLRCCMIMGPKGGYVARTLNKPLLFRVAGCDPLMQFIHEDDLVRLLVHLCDNPAPGIFNVAGDDPLPYGRVITILGKKAITLPSSLAYPLLQLSWKLGIQRDASRAGLDFIRYPIVLNTDKLEKSTGFRCRFTSEDALRAYTESRRR